jgi:protein SCO1/2
MTWAAAGLLACSRPLPVLGTVPPFQLVESSGDPLTTDHLAGHVWVANFIFTRCPDFCPALTSHMAGLQKTLADHAETIRFVSFSVDPGHDSPEVLRDYARRNGARTGWLFATGTREALTTLLMQGFHVAFADGGPPTSPITHSDRFVLVDRQQRIRGYYHGTTAAEIDRLARDARALLAEEPS